MLEFILMLLGLAFPSTDANTATNADANQTVIENVQTTNSDGTVATNSEADTGGDTTPVPIKK